MSKHLTSFCALVALSITLIFPVHAAAPFYEGKTIRIIVGFSAGGGFDTYSRLIARHLGRHIPGGPAVVVENMPGAASLVSANHVYNVAKPDGLTIVNFHGNQVINQVIGNPGIEFDARKFEYIGIPTQDNVACAFYKTSGITTFDSLRNAKTPVKFGGVAPGDTTYNTAKLLIAALKLPIQLVAGYKGTAEVRLAAESGEVAGRLLAMGVDQIHLAPGARRGQCRGRPAGQPKTPSGVSQSAQCHRFRAQRKQQAIAQVRRPRSGGDYPALRCRSGHAKRSGPDAPQSLRGNFEGSRLQRRRQEVASRYRPADG